ncbi:MAG: type II toxin-antitoxin system HicB family antitoxin [bacterium]|nr:type II toxin-antitoxin system HicB family antitoxin [bacterium]
MSKKNIISQEHSYTVVYEPIKDGGYQVTVPLLPGLITYGRIFEEAREMALDAIKCHLEGMQKDKEVIPTELGLLQEKVTVAV